jgi:hypothetical protein
MLIFYVLLEGRKVATNMVGVVALVGIEIVMPQKHQVVVGHQRVLSVSE